MSKKYIFILLLIFFLSLIILNTNVTTVYATIYRIIDTEGNTIRVITEPQMKKSEEEADCILSPIQPDIVPPISKDISRVKGIVFEDHNVNGIQDKQEKMQENGASQVHKIVIKLKKVKIGDKYGQITKNTLPGCILSCHRSGQ